MLATQHNRISHPSSHSRPETSSPEEGEEEEEEEEESVMDPTQRSITQHRFRNSHQMQQQAKQGRDSFTTIPSISIQPTTGKSSTMLNQMKWKQNRTSFLKTFWLKIFSNNRS
jgi:hypothetical protein